MSEGDYLLRRGLYMSLLDDLDRDASWKRLLRGDTKLEDHRARREVARRELIQQAAARTQQLLCAC